MVTVYGLPKTSLVLESIKAQIAWETRHWLTVESVSSDKSSDGCGDSRWEPKIRIRILLSNLFPNGWVMGFKSSKLDFWSKNQISLWKLKIECITFLILSNFLLKKGSHFKIFIAPKYFDFQIWFHTIIRKHPLLLF